MSWNSRGLSVPPFSDRAQGGLCLEGVELNEAKKVLADAATELCHGAEAAKAAAETARKTFEDGVIADDLPTVEVRPADLDAGIPAFELLSRAGLAASKAEARRLIKGGGGRLNGQVITSETQVIGTADIQSGVIKLSAGKKRHALIKPV